MYVLFDSNYSDRCEGYPIGVLIGISLMIKVVKHLFMYLLAIGISSLEWNMDSRVLGLGSC